MPEIYNQVTFTYQPEDLPKQWETLELSLQSSGTHMFNFDYQNNNKITQQERRMWNL